MKYPGQAYAESLQCVTTLRRRGGKLSITDGPFAEAREPLAGHIPPARVGRVEVRPVRELNP